MAYINVAEWTRDYVAEWLRGLDDAIQPYVHFFLNNNIDGCRLLLLSPEDLNSLNVTKIGHQELILEGIDLLRQLHYNLTSETLQTLALRLGCKARSLYNDLKRNGPQETTENAKQERVSVATLSAVSDTLTSVKTFISWLDRYPFEGQDQYIPVRKTILKLSIELASTAQRDQFVEKPHEVIKNSCLNLAELCDRIVQEINDPLIIQPALLDISTIKKKPVEELGMHIHSTYSGIHMIGGIKFQSPAHRCGKIDEGDEIIQVNYQTVVGWQLKKLVHAMKEHPTEIHLTLKKRPRHTNILGQVIILRPYRIPSKKTAYGKTHKWSEGNSSLHIQEMYPTPPAEPSSPRDDVDDDDDSTFLPDDGPPSGDQNGNTTSSAIQYVFLAKSRATVQRRATVSGASPTVTRPPVRIEDLVAGAASLFKKESVFRSVSHDPSKHAPQVTANKRPAEKPGGLSVPDTMLNPQDEQYTILENKSLMSSPDEEKEDAAAKDSGSYQVQIVGGAPQKSPSLGRATKSPAQSPFLRHKSNTGSKLATRRISCKDLGLGECEGWLYQRKDHKGFLPGLRWAKRWLVLKDNYLYCYRNQDEVKAECLIYLPGFTVSPSPECKSRKCAFKLHHSGTTFYFAAESQQAMTKWMNKMGLAAIAYTSYSASLAAAKDGGSPDIEHGYFSETDEEAEDSSICRAQESRQKLSLEKLENASQRGEQVLRFMKHGAKPEVAPKPARSSKQQDTKTSSKAPLFLLGEPSMTAHHSRKLSEPSLDPKKMAKKVYRTDRSFCTQDADAAKVESSKNRPAIVPSFRMAYIRSLSCVDNLQKSPGGSPKSSESHAASLSPLKECNESVCEVQADALHRVQKDASMATSQTLEKHDGVTSSTAGKPLPRDLPKMLADSQVLETSTDAKDSDSSDSQHSHQTMLDREYNRLYGRRKPDTIVLPSASYRASQKLPKSATSQEIHSLYTCHRESWGSGEDYFHRVAVRRSSSSEASVRHFPPDQSRSKYAEDAAQDAKALSLDRLHPEPLLDEAAHKSKRNSDGTIKAPLPSPKSNAFKLFNSPKFVKKLGSPRLDKKHFAVSPRPELPDHPTRWVFPEKILGSPRLARAIFGSKHVTSSAVQTESDAPADPEKQCDEHLKSSSNSSLNSTASTSSSSHFYVETRIHPQITISLPLVTESSADERSPDTPRTPVKPTMGVAMLGKKRTSSTASSVVEGTPATPRASPVPRQSERSEITVNIGASDDLAQLLAVLRRSNITPDGVNLAERRCRTVFRPHEDKRLSQLTLALRALKRTLKDKQSELEAMDELLAEKVTSERLEQWTSKYPHLLPPEYC